MGYKPELNFITEFTWRRLIVIPFDAKISASSDIKNYSDFLFDNCGGAILQWAIEGAKKIIDAQFHLGDYYSKLSVALDLTKADAVKMINQTNQMMENYLDISKNIINQNIDD